MTERLSVDVAIKALEDRGVARRLAEPNLIARSGQKASFLAGGEFPIPVSQRRMARSLSSYKKFGVSLDFTPTVLDDGLITSTSSRKCPRSTSPRPTTSATSRSRVSLCAARSTSIDLKNGQSFMMAGLLQSENDMVQQGVPGLSKLPVLGALFSSKAYQRRETDLVIIVTPYLVKPIDPSKKVATPADGTVSASNVDYFLGNVAEVKVSDAGRATAASSGTFEAVGVGHFLDLPKD